MLDLSILIINYNTRDLTINCLSSLYGSLKNTKLKFEVIVSDNASSDNSVKVIEKDCPKVQLIKNTKNLGFAQANNKAAKKAKGKYILFLNSDTQVQDDGIEGMVEFLNLNERIGVLGARLKNSDGSNQPSAGSFYTLPRVMLMLLGVERLGFLRYTPKRRQRVDWVSGGAMMTRKELFDKLNGFDQNFFMYLEDMEFCYRVRKIGYATYFYPEVDIKHKGLGSSNRTFAVVHIYKGLVYFYKKHGSRAELPIVTFFLYVKAFIAMMIGTITGNGYLQSTYRKAISF